MTNEPRWEDSLNQQPDAAANPAPTSAPQQPQQAQQPRTRRELREMEARQQAAPVAAAASVSANTVNIVNTANTDAAFDSFFASQPVATQPTAGTTGGSGTRGSGTGDDGAAPREKKPKRRGRFIWLFILIGLLAAAAGAAAYVWLNYEEQVREVMGWELPIDYEGSGNGEEVIVVIQSGDIGADIAQTLYDDGVTMTVTSFYDLLLTRPEDRKSVV